MLTKFFEVSLKDYGIKEKIVMVRRRWFSFVESFSTTSRAFLKMVFPITVMANVSMDETFTTVVRIFTKLAFFSYVCSLSGGLTSKFWMLWNPVQLYGLVWLKNFVDMFARFFGSITSRYPLVKSQYRFARKTSSQNVIICATNNHILY